MLNTRIDAAAQDQHSKIHNQVVDLFLKWKACANCGKTLKVLLNLYFKDLAEQDNLRTRAENEELALFFNLLGSLTEIDLTKMQNDLDDLIEDRAA